jgi:hypothetical protein
VVASCTRAFSCRPGGVMVLATICGAPCGALVLVLRARSQVTTSASSGKGLLVPISWFTVFRLSGKPNWLETALLARLDLKFREIQPYPCLTRRRLGLGLGDVHGLLLIRLLLD